MFTLPYKVGGGCCDSCATSTPCSCSENPCCVCDDSYGGGTINVSITQNSYTCSYYWNGGPYYIYAEACDTTVVNFTAGYGSGCLFNTGVTGTIRTAHREMSNVAWNDPELCNSMTPPCDSCDIPCLPFNDDSGAQVVPICYDITEDLGSGDYASIGCTGNPGVYSLVVAIIYWGGGISFDTVCGPGLGDGSHRETSLTASCCSGNYSCTDWWYSPFAWIFEPYVGGGGSDCRSTVISWSISNCNPVYPG